jgi:hypothetical protein
LFLICSDAPLRGDEAVHPQNTEPNEGELWLKRQAIQVVMQLPDDKAEALRVLDYARRLVTDFLAEDNPDKSAEVVPLFAR